MRPEWISHDTIQAPATALDEATGAIGDGVTLIRAEDPRFEEWASWLELRGAERPPALGQRPE